MFSALLCGLVHYYLKYTHYITFLCVRTYNTIKCTMKCIGVVEINECIFYSWKRKVQKFELYDQNFYLFSKNCCKKNPSLKNKYLYNYICSMYILFCFLRRQCFEKTLCMHFMHWILTHQSSKYRCAHLIVLLYHLIVLRESVFL